MDLSSILNATSGDPRTERQAGCGGKSCLNCVPPSLSFASGLSCPDANEVPSQSTPSDEGGLASMSVPSRPFSSDPVPPSDANRWHVISKIEEVFQNIQESILEDKEKLSITLLLRRTSSGQAPECNATSCQPPSSSPSRKICFPGQTPREAWTFTVVVRILEMIHEGLINNVITTKRDLFYKDPQLFRKQGVVDQYVDDIACTFGVQRACLNVVAAAKGLVTGALKLVRLDHSVLDCASDLEGTLIPNIKDIQDLDMTAVRWILVIEKQATFHSLAATAFWRKVLIGEGLLITAKGYPDISTRAFLRRLSTHPTNHEPHRPPIYGLVDFDPDGLGILSTYKHGSVALAHENAQLRIPSLHWLGIRSKDIPLLDGNGDGRGLLRMTARDRSKACALLGKKISEEMAEEREWRRELQVMLMLNVKAEMQILSDAEGGLERWLERSITMRYLAGR